MRSHTKSLILYPQTMFTDSNNNGDDSFTVPSSSDRSLLYSRLLNEMSFDAYNPCSSPFLTSFYEPFSVIDSSFVSSHYDEQEPEDTFLLFNHQEQQPALTAYQDFTAMATSSNAVEGHSKTEDFHRHESSSNNVKKGTEAKLVAKSRGSSSKDRHSKIITAQGPRDRRIRLSQDIAPRFFDLQDMLGFDKPSKTLEWLLFNSQSEINIVARSKNNDTSNSITTKSDSFSASECCEEVSQVVDKNDEIPQSEATNTDKESKKASSKERKRSRASIPSGKEVITKESREKARAWARERTKEKGRTKQYFSNMDHYMPSLMSQVGKPAAAAPFLGTHDYACIGLQDLTMAVQNESSVKNILDWNSSSAIFNHLQEHNNNDNTQQMQFEDNQLYSRSQWDAYR